METKKTESYVEAMVKHIQRDKNKLKYGIKTRDDSLECVVCKGHYKRPLKVLHEKSARHIREYNILCNIVKSIID